MARGFDLGPGGDSVPIRGTAPITGLTPWHRFRDPAINANAKSALVCRDVLGRRYRVRTGNDGLRMDSETLDLSSNDPAPEWATDPELWP